MSGARLTTARLRQLAAELPDRYTEPVLHLSRARALSGGQLDRLLRQPGTTPKTAERARQRAMTHLCHLGLAATLERRIGGVRAGSAGYVHVLTPAGHKLAALLTGQQPPRRIRHSRAPGPMFIAHALDTAEIYVQLTEHSRAGSFRVAAFITEPDSWWQESGIVLRPDAYTRLATPTHRDCWWLEIDRDTESIPRLREKFRDYLDHANYGGTGPDDALPRVLVTAPTPRRCAVTSDLITGLPPPAAELFAVCEHTQAVRELTKALHDQ
ncbi:MAG: replication-relaxation family protein [Actinomycetota bacterium]|nr:replication-relaxation family protein [Actinomycetota bacterium]